MQGLAAASVTSLLAVFSSTAAALGAIEIDGTLDEETWASAATYTGFFVTKPLSLEKAPEKTQVLVLQSEEGLYI
ncbi:hypothetical protein C0039_09515 [Pseudohalioglobus lutimaris]|uniref:Uncharacterized protein n=1 Tax=Pseudohalioglobus lutimaris TaxID=1737061 RepID=A0A2N5X2Z2_9GAMM|nr:hypothetical protein C0039_09515 [Pseudohalioglobus lutimaris]